MDEAAFEQHLRALDKVNKCLSRLVVPLARKLRSGPRPQNVEALNDLVSQTMSEVLPPSLSSDWTVKADVADAMPTIFMLARERARLDAQSELESHEQNVLKEQQALIQKLQAEASEARELAAKHAAAAAEAEKVEEARLQYCPRCQRSFSRSDKYCPGCRYGEHFVKW